MLISPVHFPTYTFKPRHARGDSFFDRAFYFRRGSWALAYGIMAIAKKRGKDKVHVWFPDYFCREPFEILKQFPVEIRFYPVTQELVPDFDVLEQMIKENVPEALVLVHYFGFPNDLEGAKAFCGKHGIDLIEDCAHVMASFGEVGTSGALSLWSPWKFFPLPLLGVLQAKEEFGDLIPVLHPRQGTLSGIRWSVKREIQRALCMMGINWYKHLSSQPACWPVCRQGRSFPKRGEEVKTDHSLYPSAFPDVFSLRLFKRYIEQADDIRPRRRENYKMLEAFFEKKYPEMVLFDKLPEGVTPYIFPLILKESADKYVGELVNRNIPATKWPALPEVVQADAQRFEWAHYYAKHLMVLSIHQSISLTQIVHMIEQLNIVLR